MKVKNNCHGMKFVEEIPLEVNYTVSVILSRSEHLTVRTSLDSELVKSFAPSRALLVSEKPRIGNVKYIYLKLSKKFLFYLNDCNQSNLIKK